MICIRFKDSTMEKRALGFLARHFACKTWADGKTLVPEEALPLLAREGFSFTVEGRATYEQLVPAIRDLPPTPVQ